MFTIERRGPTSQASRERCGISAQRVEILVTRPYAPAVPLRHIREMTKTSYFERWLARGDRPVGADHAGDLAAAPPRHPLPHLTDEGAGTDPGSVVQYAPAVIRTRMFVKVAKFSRLFCLVERPILRHAEIERDGQA